MAQNRHPSRSKRLRSKSASPQTGLCRFKPSSPFYGQFSFQKWPFLGYFQDNRPENSRPSPVCQVDICNEGRRFSMAIGLSNDGEWVLNTACTMPWCHTVVHFEVKMSHFEARIRTIVPTMEAYLQSKRSFFNGDVQCVTQD